MELDEEKRSVYIVCVWGENDVELMLECVSRVYAIIRQAYKQTVYGMK